MGAAVVGCAVSADILYPTFPHEGHDALHASADELCQALFANYRHTSDFFMANPTPQRWRAFVRAHACWKVAFLAEDDGGRP